VTELSLKLLIAQARIAPLKNHLKQCRDNLRAAEEETSDKEQAWRQVGVGLWERWGHARQRKPPARMKQDVHVNFRQCMRA
jgi:hypothetical protein